MHIVVIASLGLSVFGWILTDRFLWELAGLVALDWFLVNLLNRVVDLEEDQINRIPGTRWVKQFRHPIWCVGVLLLLISLVVVHLLAPWCTLWRLGFHGLGFLYNRRLRPGWPRIKELYLLKNIASATGFMITLFGYLLASIGYASTSLASGIDWVVVSFLATYFFLFELSYEVTYDLRDVPGDQEAGVRTLPVVHGPEWAKNIVLSLCATSSGLLWGGFVAGWIPWRVAVLAVGPMVHGVLIFRSRRRGVSALDCVRWTWAGSGLLLLFHFWVFLKLPGVR
jgi:4-hydroxybenzoate polyprenyltransferase